MKPIVFLEDNRCLIFINPNNRDETGFYLDSEEWTCFSEVGTKVSEEDYLRTESNYINAITTFMDEIGLNKVYLNDIEK